MPEEEDMEGQELFEVDAGVEELQIRKLAGVKSERNHEEVRKRLGELSEAIDQDENLMPHIIEAVKSYATVGEICGIMREKWGEFKSPTYI
jgi:methylmalonyl-CoA mutase N-terminal domain/subunit